MVFSFCFLPGLGLGGKTQSLEALTINEGWVVVGEAIVLAIEKVSLEDAIEDLWLCSNWGTIWFISGEVVVAIVEDVVAARIMLVYIVGIRKKIC